MVVTPLSTAVYSLHSGKSRSRVKERRESGGSRSPPGSHLYLSADSPWREVENESEERHDCDADADGQGDSLDPADLRSSERLGPREERRHQNVSRSEEYEEDREDVAHPKRQERRGHDNDVAHGHDQVPRFFPKMQPHYRPLDRCRRAIRLMVFAGAVMCCTRGHLARLLQSRRGGPRKHGWEEPNRRSSCCHASTTGRAIA